MLTQTKRNNVREPVNNDRLLALWPSSSGKTYLGMEKIEQQIDCFFIKQPGLFNGMTALIT